MTHFLRFILRLSLVLLTAKTITAANLVTYTGGSGNQQFWQILELSDGSFLVCGSADDLSWIPNGVSTSLISETTANGSIIDDEGISEDRVGFIARFSSDLTTILEVAHFADGVVDEIRFIKATTPPHAATTGELFISGKRGAHTTGSKDGGFYIAKLNNNFLSGPPTAIEYAINIPTHGKDDIHAEIQPWDVTNDGRLLSIRYGAYKTQWGEINVFPSNPGTPANPEHDYGGDVIMPGFRYHQLDDGTTFFGTADTIPNGKSSVRSRHILKNQGTTAVGELRSFTLEDYNLWQKDENGYWRKGKYPLDVMFNNFWDYATTGTNTSGSRGYTGYRLANHAFTPRVGVITVDKRNNHIYYGVNWPSILPQSNLPDFEPAVVALDEQGYQKWWARLYKEYDDHSGTPPQKYEATVSSVLATDRLIASSLIGTDIDVAQRNDVNRRLYWTSGANVPRRSNILAYDSTTGEITLEEDPPSAIQAGDEFVIDGTVMSKTLNSTPDQYIEGIVIDYNRPLQADGSDANLYISARAHGNNVSNFWKGNDITANPGSTAYHNGFTGNNGNIHMCWVGKFRDRGSSSTVLASSYVAEYAESGEFASTMNYGASYADPNLDFWPDHNQGWANLNTTYIEQSMFVDDQGRLCILGTGRATVTTKNAYQRNIRPRLVSELSAVESQSKFTVTGLIGSDLIMSDGLIMKLTTGDVSNRHVVKKITAFDNTTGEITIESPLPVLPAIRNTIKVDEGTGAWNSFIRVFSEDMSTLEYSTLLTSDINPVDASGAGDHTTLHGLWPIQDGLIVVGFHQLDYLREAQVLANLENSDPSNTTTSCKINLKSSDPVGMTMKVLTGSNRGFTATVTSYDSTSKQMTYTPASSSALIKQQDKLAIYNEQAKGNPVPTVNVPAWGSSTPDQETGLLAKLHFSTTASPTGYATWAADYNWMGETQTAANQDPDRDGLDNFTEYALGSSPIDASDTNLPVISKHSDTQELSIHLGRDSSEVTYTVEFSEDLNDWLTIPSVALSGSAGETKLVPLDMSGYSRLFARLKITQ